MYNTRSDDAIEQDLSGRPHLSFDLEIPTQRIGTYDTQLVEHFFQSLANTSGMTLHVRQVLLPFFSPDRDGCCSAGRTEFASYRRGLFQSLRSSAQNSDRNRSASRRDDRKFERCTHTTVMKDVRSFVHPFAIAPSLSRPWLRCASRRRRCCSYAGRRCSSDRLLRILSHHIPCFFGTSKITVEI